MKNTPFTPKVDSEQLIINSGNQNVSFSKFGTSQNFRYKRDIQESRRVVKKLVSKRLIEAQSAPRRRITITKVRKIQPTTTKRRRVVVITRKRLLNSTSVLESPIQTLSSDLDVEVPYELYQSFDSIPNDDDRKTKIFASNNLLKFTTYIEPNIILSPSSILPNFTDDQSSIFPTETISEPCSFLTSTKIVTSTNLVYETLESIYTKLRTYTLLVTRVNGDEQITTSTTSLKPQVKTTTVTNTFTELKTVTTTEIIAPSSPTQNVNTVSTIVYSSDGCFYYLPINNLSVENITSSDKQDSGTNLNQSGEFSFFVPYKFLKQQFSKKKTCLIKLSSSSRRGVAEAWIVKRN